MENRPKLIDAHTHVQFAAFKDDWRSVIQRALEAGVWMVNVGAQKSTSLRAVEFSHEFEGVWATVGLHPIHTEKSYHDPQELGLPAEVSAKEGGGEGFVSSGEEFDYEYYKNLALDPKVVAIGECGLDYYRISNISAKGGSASGGKNQKLQEDVFIKQIELAREVKKPLMIHCRSAYDDLIKLLTANYQLLTFHPGVVHFFSGTKEQARKLLDMGFSFTFGGVITFTRDYDEVVKYIPLDRILLETDAPYVAPVPYRGQRNEPIYVIEVAKKMAELKGMDFEEVARRTVENARKLFGI